MHSVTNAALERTSGGMPKSPAQARAFEETASPGHRLIEPSASAAIRGTSSQSVKGRVQVLARRNSPVQVGQVLRPGSLLRTGARDGTLRLAIVDRNFHVRKHERKLAREHSVQEDVCCTGGGQSQRRTQHSRGETRGRTLEMRSKDRPRLRQFLKISLHSTKCDRGGRPAYRLRAKLEQVFDHAAKQASSVVRLGPFAELVDNKQRA